MRKQSQSSSSNSSKQAGSRGRQRNNAGTTGGRSSSKNSTAKSGSNGKTQMQPEAGTDTQQLDSPLEKLFVNLLQQMYFAERNSIDALETMQTEATTDELQDAFEDHRFATEKHAARLEKVFSLLGLEPKEKDCPAIEALTTEAEEMINMTEEGSMTRDVALVICAQKMEHYEIACYGSLVELALTLGNEKVAFILEKTLLEEEQADLLLTDIAECAINPWADEEPEEVMAEYEEEDITA